MNNNRTEQWKSIKGYEGKYEVSNKGRVRTLNWKGTGETKVLTLNPNPRTGYIQIGLYEPETKQTTSKYIHRLVAEAFLPNPNNLEQVDHIDGNRQRNSVSNLRWVSRKFNNSRKRVKMLKSQNHSVTSHTHQFVKASKGDEVKYFKSINVAAKQLGFSHVLGIKVIRGEFKSAKGWKLEYIERASTEGMNAKVDVRTKKDIRSDLRKELKKQRKARVKELALPPKLAHCVMSIDEDGNTRIYPNTYQAEKTLGICGVRDCLMGFKETTGGYHWTWLYN